MNANVPASVVRQMAPAVQSSITDAPHNGSPHNGSPTSESAAAPAARMPPELLAANRTFAVLVLDASGTIVRANNRFLRQMAIDPAGLVGRSLASITVLARDNDTDIPRLLAQLRRGESRVVEIGRRDASGALRWFQAYYTLLRETDGQAGQIVEMSFDITERVLSAADDHGQIEAIRRTNAIVEFATDGTILDANERFLALMGYGLDEVRGRHHRMFVDDLESASTAYADFWRGLAEGQHQPAELRRFGAERREVWLRATYSPVLDPTGQVQKIVKYAIDVTAERLQQAEFEWHIAALHRSHCMITFDRHGVVIDANEAMLAALGYRLEDIVGRHHRMFVEPAYAHGAEYHAFWRALEAGRFQSGQYRRLGRGGREIWLQANYSPVFDPSGALVKVVKYASVITDEKRRQAEHQGQIAAIHRAQCVIAFELDGTIVDANENFLDAVGYRLSDVRGRHHRLFVDAETAASTEYHDFWAALGRGEVRSGEFRRVGRDGRELWLQATYNPIFDSSGRPVRVVKYATDVTAQKWVQADVQGQIEAINKSQGVITFALDGTILSANERFLDVFGYAIGEVVGQHHRKLLDIGDAEGEAYREFWDTLRAGQHVSGRYRRISRDGRPLWLQASYNPVFDHNGKLWKIVKFATDVSSDVAMAEAYEDAKRQAQHDPATSLPNRARLTHFLVSALAEANSRVAVLYLDLDNFKPVNDTFGHPVGDRVLGAVADRLRRTLRGDQMVARIGGDEFIIAAPQLSDEEIEAHCQHIIEVVAAPIRHEAADLTVGVSIGVAVAPHDGDTPDELLRSADTALYRAKQDGRGGYRFFASEMNDRLRANRQLTEDMRRALDADEFYLEFQPRYDAHDQTIRSAEALVRWAHPELGRLGPDRFIPLAERNGLILRLGEWVLEQACTAASRWPAVGVSVNVSPVQFRDGRLVERVREVLARTGLDPTRLELEVTEGVLVEDAARAGQALRELKALGIRLAIDDFGTGYSSLSYLRNFPFDVIKIDRHFVSDIESRKDSRDIVKAILALGRALGLSVTAEGVETEGQLRMLVEDDCAEVQGFLLSRPVAGQDFALLLGNLAGHPGGG